MLALNPVQWLDTANPNTIRVLRFTLGVTLSFAVSLAVTWPLYYITPIFVAKFLGSPAPCPTLRMGIIFSLVIALGCATGLAVSLVTGQYPVVCLLTIAILLFHIFYANVRGSSPLVVMFFLLGVTAIPLMGLESFALATAVAGGLLLSASLALIFVWIAYGLIPDRVGTTQVSAPKKEQSTLSSHEQIRSAAISTLVVLPVVVLFYTYKMTDLLLVLVFIAILAQQPDIKLGIKGSIGLIAGNTLGGLVAIGFYNLLIAVPSFVFLILMTVVVALLFSEQIFSGKPRAGLYTAAFSTLILLIGSTTGDFGGDAASKFYTRIVHIVIAATYIVGTFAFLELLSRRKQKQDSADQSGLPEYIDVV